jgi:hypothetical protein
LITGRTRSRRFSNVFLGGSGIIIELRDICIPLIEARKAT